MRKVLIITAAVLALMTSIPAAHAEMTFDQQVEWVKSQYKNKDKQKLVDEVARVLVYEKYCGQPKEKYVSYAKVVAAAFPETVAASREYFEHGLQTLGQQRSCGIMKEAGAED